MNTKIASVVAVNPQRLAFIFKDKNCSVSFFLKQWVVKRKNKLLRITSEDEGGGKAVRSQLLGKIVVVDKTQLE